MAKYIENGRRDNIILLKLKSTTRSNNTLSNIPTIILYCADIVIVIYIIYIIQPIIDQILSRPEIKDFF